MEGKDCSVIVHLSELLVQACGISVTTTCFGTRLFSIHLAEGVRKVQQPNNEREVERVAKPSGLQIRLRVACDATVARRKGSIAVKLRSTIVLVPF